MPRKAKHGCPQQGCVELVDAGYCLAHVKPRRITAYEDSRLSARQRGYGRHWEKLRLCVLREEPLCRICLMGGRTEPSTDVDHMIPKAAGGSDQRSNLQGLCHSCHSRKTRREQHGV